MPKVVILCGGQGTRLKEETEYKPKPMVRVGTKPILWHILKLYSYYGFYDFILCLGYKGDIIKEFFNNYNLMNYDFSINIGSRQKQIYMKNTDENNWNITLCDTGENAMTGSRIKQVEKYINDDDFFMVTYGDAIADINIVDLIKFHKSHGKLATLTGIRPDSKYGVLQTQDNLVKRFNEKPRVNDYVNGGFFIFEKEVLKLLDADIDCILEKNPLEKLANSNNLAIYKHEGFWQCMDTYRDYKMLNEMYNENNTPWMIWKNREDSFNAIY